MNADKLDFPLRCHFRVVGEKTDAFKGAIEVALAELGVADTVEESNTSKGGKYISYNITTVVESREAMDAIDRKLWGIDGVKMVL